MPCNQVDIVQKKTFNSHKLTKNYAMALIRILVGDLNSHLQNQLEKNGQFNLELISDSELLSLLMAKLLMLTQTTYGGEMTGIIQLYSKLVNLSFKDHIKLLFMVVKTAVMDH